ncbi:MAG: aldo/keto reductase [Cytophagaceae bacterium]|nr:aldo/keto reductase [Gemmatimonadaceae bacterium]
MVDVPQIFLAPDYSVSRLIKGGWQLAGGHGVVPQAAAHHHMAAFVDAGITTFDCADIYTGVESLIGEFLRTRPRGAVQVHTKCVPDLGRLATLTAHDIATTVDRSRTRLGVDALDLVQFHWWDLARGDFVAAARTLGDLQAAGALRHIGLTNFAVAPLERILDAGVPVVSHQVQYSLLDRRPASAMADLCVKRGIGLLCYGALAGGFMHERWLGAAEPAEPLENRSLVKYKLIIDECGGWARFQSLLSLLSGIAAEHGVRLGAIAIRWVLDQPGVAAVIVGARNTAHLPDTLAALTVELSAYQRDRLSDFLLESPAPRGDVYELERDREGRHGRIMRYDLGR